MLRLSWCRLWACDKNLVAYALGGEVLGEPRSKPAVVLRSHVGFRKAPGVTRLPSFTATVTISPSAEILPSRSVFSRLRSCQVPCSTAGWLDEVPAVPCHNLPVPLYI